MTGNSIVSRFTNVAIRSAVMASRLLLMVSLARFLPAEDVGLFGLIFVTINLGQMLAGAEFHSFSNRKIVGAPDAQKSQNVFNQLVLYVALYALLTPVALTLFAAGLFPWDFLWLFLAILVFEHLSYEAYRLFIILGRPLTASIISFVRGGIWVFPMLLLFLWSESLQTLKITLLMWLLGGLMSFIYSASALYRAGWSFSSVALDIAWIKRGLRVAFPFLVGAIALRSILTLDRYLLESLSDLAVVGAYTFYVGMCNALFGFVEAAVLNFAYPTLISAANALDGRKFTASMRLLSMQTFAVTIVIAIVLYLVSLPLMQFLEDPVYLKHLDLFRLLLAAFGLLVFSQVPQLGLYATKCDSANLRGNLAALVAFLTSFAFLHTYFPGLYSVPAAMIFAFGAKLLVKTYYFFVMAANFSKPQESLPRK